MNTGGTGSAGSEYWNTLVLDGGIYNLYLKDGLNFLNNGEGPGTRINVNLLPGSYTFNIFAEPGSGGSSFGPNPGTTRQLKGIPVAGANTSTFPDGSNTVFLGGFYIVSPIAAGSSGRI